MLIILAFASTVSWIVRYRFLNMYARLPPEPQRKEPEIELFPDTQGDSKPGLASYLDEFLSAIKVFGYLERPVFHELTRTMQTRKLRAGETLLLEEEKGFCLVVDGLVQIFVKSGRKANEWGPGDSIGASDEDEDDMERRENGNQGYSLLTEVKNGAPMSSLFSILSLFTEDVQLRYTEEEDNVTESALSTAVNGHARSPTTGDLFSGESMSSSAQLSPVGPPENISRPPISRDRSSSAAAGLISRHGLPDIPPLSLEGRPPQEQRLKQGSGYHGNLHTHTRSRKVKSVHPDILARATVDTTIAIIPASAFRRLTRVYPKATAHIVQVILARLQRVTLATGHSYLGLTSEILRTERCMNEFTTYDLPNFLRGRALDRLKQKFLKERARVGQGDDMKGIALHNSGRSRRRSSGSGLRMKAVDQATVASAASKSISNDDLTHSVPLNRFTSGSNPGDLLTDAPLSRHASLSDHSNPSVNLLADQTWQGLDLVLDTAHSPLTQFTSNPFLRPVGNILHRQESLDEDGMFRVSVLECILKAIGLAKSKAPTKPLSEEQSPKLISYDSKRQVAVFNNAFGWIDPYEPSDSESIASASPSAYSAGGGYSMHGLNEELKDDIEIVHFPKGSILVEQGERNPGLYYVIDGFLDVGMQVITNDSESDVLPSSESPPIPRSGIGSFKASGSKDMSLSPGSGVGFSQRAKRNSQSKTKSLFIIKPGGIAGYIGTISSYRSFIDVKAKTDVYVGFLPRSSLERIVERFPIVLLTMAKRLTTLLPRLILHIDFALEWLQVNAGQVIYHQKDESDAIYIVLNGRLRSIMEKQGGEMRVLGEYGQGESVGELEVMTESTRPGTLHAIRDTELAKFPKSLFNTLALEHPAITIKISKIIASRMRALVEDRLLEGSDGFATTANKRANSTVNLRTVAILPVTSGVPVIEFGSRLMNALVQIGTPNGVTSLNQAAILNHLGRHAFSRMGKLKLSQYLADLEEKYGMVLYVADTSVNSPWTQTCISQADCILLVGLAEGSPDIGEYERFLLGMKTTARKELVLLHADRYSPPGLTRKWLRVSEDIATYYYNLQLTALEPAVDQWKSSPYSDGVSYTIRTSAYAD